MKIERPSRQQAENAVKTLLEWAGDDPSREGLVDTPKRVAKAYEEFFAGYQENPIEILQKSSFDSAGYSDMVILKDIRFESHCEHHISPIIGKVHIAYIPHDRVVGISKLARVCDVYAKRLQIQEAMTESIAHDIDYALKPKGVAVLSIASHECMTTRGVYKPGMSMVTRSFKGEFATDRDTRQEFLQLITSSTV